MIKNIVIGLLSLVIAIGGYALSRDNVGAPSGPAHWQMESFLEGVSAGQRDQFSVSRTGAVTTSGALTVSGASTFGADITVTSTNTATSSIAVGCIESYATSTATVMRLSATTTAPSTATWVYGACSEL